MLIVRDYKSDSEVYVLTYREFSDSDLANCKRTFEKFKENGVIINCKYEDTIWTVTNEVRRHFVKFKLNELAYAEERKKRELPSLDTFVNCLKAIFLTYIQVSELSTLTTNINKVIKVIEQTNFLAIDKIDNLETDESSYAFWTNIFNYKRVQDVIAFRDFCAYSTCIPNSQEYVAMLDVLHMELIEVARSVQKEPLRRQLSDFQSYFLFDTILNKAWENNLSHEEKLLYYPIYLYWNITTILPIRVTEFLVTPKDCISYKDDKYYLTIRRSKLKGLKKFGFKDIHHKIEKDYTCHTYEIPEKIAKEILTYKDEVAKVISNPKYDLLISWEHYGYLFGTHEKELYSETMYTRANLDILLRRFYVEIIQDKLGYIINEKPLADDIPLATEKEIKPFKLGDTRHIAMINMLLSGVSPLTIRDFAGHTRSDTTYHYIGNVDNLVKCYTYAQYRHLCEHSQGEIVANYKQENRVTQNKIFARLENDNFSGLEVDNGICYSPRFAVQDVSDCQKCEGNCLCCDWFERTKHESIQEQAQSLEQLELALRKDGELIGKLFHRYKDTVMHYNEVIRATESLKHHAAMYMHLINKGGNPQWINQEK